MENVTHTMDVENTVDVMKSAEYENSVREVSIAIKTVEIFKDEEIKFFGLFNLIPL